MTDKSKTPQLKLYHMRLDAKKPAAEAIDIAADALRMGLLVAFPTETVYGLGANALNKHAVASVFLAKERPPTDPLIVHIASVDQLDEVAREIPPLARELGRRFWPGPLTLVLKKAPHIMDLLTAGLDTVAVRVPDHPVAAALLEAAQVPIAAPSANRFSRPSPTSAQHVLDDLGDEIDIVLDAGATAIGVESSIVDLSQAEPKLLRPGGLSMEALSQVMPGLPYAPRYLGEDELAPAPGSLLKHYSPRAPLLLFAGSDQARVMAAMKSEIANHQRVGIIAGNADASRLKSRNAKIERLGKNSQESAKRLFAAMRSLDKQGVDVILARLPDKHGMGLALRDRLLRAAEGKVIEV